MNQSFYRHHCWASTHHSIYLSHHFLLSTPKFIASSQFKSILALEIYCFKCAMPGLRSDPSLLTVWSFYRACLSNIYLEAANPYLPDSHVILDLLADQLISSSGIIFQGNSTKHCPSWDLLCQDFKGRFLSVTRRLVPA